MNPERPPDDPVDRALVALLGTPGPAAPPAELTARLRRSIAENQSASVTAVRPRTVPRERASPFRFAVALSLMIAAGWGVGFHRRLLSDVAGRQCRPDGSCYSFYTDGRVVGLADSSTDGERSP